LYSSVLVLADRTESKMTEKKSKKKRTWAARKERLAAAKGKATTSRLLL